MKKVPSGRMGSMKRSQQYPNSDKELCQHRIDRMYSDRQDLANSVDPDETPLNAASHQGLHRLPFILQFLETISGSELYLFKF